MLKHKEPTYNKKIHNNSSDTRNAMQHKESLEANSQKSKEEYEI